ncbi:hypothetical protein TrRE_jg4702 [Triparma retinervis]|uniref:Uncharacterized protein n=1 Tax=Triparma retinervis TaxID=2557542 RepID=A0A9W6ZF39_9STRA|nr:hypothetical protein TrRE_jg4702 [Triparma retinervis]
MLLDGPTLDVASGDTIFLTGKSGAGKSLWMSEMMACLNGTQQMGDGISCSGEEGIEKLRGVWCDRYTVCRSKTSPTVSSSIIDGLDSMITTPCILFVDELLDTESEPVRRPTWLTISMSVPTGLLWYGYYKFSVEEELFQMELRETGRVSGAGGYGTLVGFSYAVIFGGIFSLLPLTEGFGELILRGAGILLLASQVNLYVRVNELCEEVGMERPLHPWWALLPPPLDVVVGLRQVHYLALYATKVREEEWKGDFVAEEWFPFISSERFTLEEFVREPKRWFGLPFLNTKEWDDFW